ncbi:MAG TPA: DMT family transporter [Gaiellaceae bacterium]|nr:DMT family transporter [Gaiellaceae bacterium]
MEAAADAPAKTRDYAALGAAGITIVLWASAFVGIRSAGRSFSPGALSLGRLTVAVVALAVIGLARGDRLPSLAALKHVALPLLACGLLWFGAYNVALNSGERRVDAGTAAMLVNIGPILIAVLAGILLREGFPRSLFTGLAVAFAGVIVIGVASSTHTATTEGVLLCVASAFAYAGGVVAQKVVLRVLTPIQTVFFCAVIGALVCAPFAPQLVRQLGPVHGEGWLLYLGIGPTALGFIFWGFALSRTSAGKLAVTTYLIPPISVLLGWLWLGESPAALAYLGGALALAGVAVSRKPARVIVRRSPAAQTDARMNRAS